MPSANSVLKLYNTLSRTKEVFEPLDASHIKMYVCGPTVYTRPHIGNARPVVVFDVLFRLLKYLYPKVTYTRNITDIDDKIITAAQTNKESMENLTSRTIEHYHEDTFALNALPPTFEPRATAYIPQMQNLIQSLIEKEHAYIAENHVLFDVKSNPTYGCLSRITLKEQIAGARVDVAPYKKNSEDFVLWKPSPPAIPGWDSPWGRGRPGWHLECSAMATDTLGIQFDIHGGGIDLLFPHHENEIAQSICAHGNINPARYWMHNGHLFINGEKMSKSLGNFFTVHDLLTHYPGEVLRLTLLSSHYRQPLDWTEITLQQSKNVIDKFYRALEGFNEQCDPGPFPESFLDALHDDLNIPLAIQAMHDLGAQIHKTTSISEKHSLQKQLKAMGEMLGLLSKTSDEWFQSPPSSARDLSSVEIENFIHQRNEARGKKDFKRADEIRATLDQAGVILEDGDNGTTWKRK